MAHLGDRVAAYVDGQLPDDEAERADAHLADCDECFEAVLAQRALKRRMTGLCATPTPSSTFLSALSDPARLAAAAPPSRLHLILDHVVVRVGIAATGASAVLAGIAYAVGAPATPADTVAPPVEQFVAQFRGEADPVQQSVGAVGGSPSDVALVVAPGHAVAPARTDSTEAVSLLEQALGSSVSVRLLANRYDLSVIRSSPGRSEVVAAVDGRRVAAYVIGDADGRLRQVVRYAQQQIADPVFQAVRPVSRTEGIRVQGVSAPLRASDRAAAEDLTPEHGGLHIDPATCVGCGACTTALPTASAGAVFDTMELQNEPSFEERGIILVTGTTGSGTVARLADLVTGPHEDAPQQEPQVGQAERSISSTSPRRSRIWARTSATPFAAKSDVSSNICSNCIIRRQPIRSLRDSALRCEALTVKRFARVIAPGRTFCSRSGSDDGRQAQPWSPTASPAWAMPAPSCGAGSASCTPRRRRPRRRSIRTSTRPARRR